MNAETSGLPQGKRPTPRRTISDALRDEDIDRAMSQGESRRRPIVPRDPAARPLNSEGAFRRVPMRYE